MTYGERIPLDLTLRGVVKFDLIKGYDARKFYLSAQ